MGGYEKFSTYLIYYFDLAYCISTIYFFQFLLFLLVGREGIEPSSLAGHDLKSCAYTNFATSPFEVTSLSKFML